MMEPRIVQLPDKNLAGLNIQMSLADNRTGELWKSFMPRLKEFTNALGTDLYSLQVYPDDYFMKFSLHTEFRKWALIEVYRFDPLPPGMQPFRLSGGLYAVFDYKGPAGSNEIFQYIYATWLPGSSYQLDQRPHFEILGDRYKGFDPDSEEEIWIPVKPKF